MKMINTELVYVTKDLCSDALVSKPNTDYTGSNTDTAILVMTECICREVTVHHRLSVMFCEVDCITKIINNCTLCWVRDIVRKIPTERTKLTNHIVYRCSPHQVQLSDQVPTKSERAFQLGLTSIFWHDIIAMNSRFYSSMGGGYVPACNLHESKCGNIEDRHLCVVAQSSCGISDKSVILTTDDHVSGICYYYRRIKQGELLK